MQINLPSALASFVGSPKTGEQYEREGQIAIVSSIAGTKPLGTAVAYSATKRMQSHYLTGLNIPYSLFLISYSLITMFSARVRAMAWASCSKCVMYCLPSLGLVQKHTSSTMFWQLR